jgi:hypothetical protein
MPSALEHRNHSNYHHWPKSALSFAKYNSHTDLGVESSWARKAGSALRAWLATRPLVTCGAFGPSIPARPLGAGIAGLANRSGRPGIAIESRQTVCAVLSVRTCVPIRQRNKQPSRTGGSGTKTARRNVPSTHAHTHTNTHTHTHTHRPGAPGAPGAPRDPGWPGCPRRP